MTHLLQTPSLRQLFVEKQFRTNLYKDKTLQGGEFA